MSLVALVAVGIVAVVATLAAVRYRSRAGALDASRQRLAALALDAEAREQRRISELLHDGPLQTLAATAQDLDEAAQGDGDAWSRAAAGLDLAIGEVRGAVADLHPTVAEQLGLGPALREIALTHARRRGFTVELEVDRETVGGDDRALLFLARELIANAAAHAAPSHVTVRLAREDASNVLEVIDDGCGFEETARRTALRNGHIGLAACRERVEALGGSFEMESAPGVGTRARIELPMDRERRRFAREERPVTRSLPAER